MTWLDRILATACNGEDGCGEPAGSMCKRFSYQNDIVRTLNVVCASRVQAAEGAPPPAQPAFDPAVCRHVTLDRGFSICRICGLRTGKKDRP